MEKIKISVLEFFLIQVAFYTIIWLFNEYIGSLLSIIFPPIFFMVLFIALIAEWIEPSRVPRKFFYYLISAILAPVMVGILFAIIYRGQFDWFAI